MAKQNNKLLPKTRPLTQNSHPGLLTGLRPTAQPRNTPGRCPICSAGRGFPPSIAQITANSVVESEVHRSCRRRPEQIPVRALGWAGGFAWRDLLLAHLRHKIPVNMDW